MIDEIRESIRKIESKGYKIEEILLNDEVLHLVTDSFNKIYGDNALELKGITTLFGYDAGFNFYDERPVVFRVAIGMEDIIGGDK